MSDYSYECERVYRDCFNEIEQLLIRNLKNGKAKKYGYNDALELCLEENKKGNRVKYLVVSYRGNSTGKLLYTRKKITAKKKFVYKLNHQKKMLEKTTSPDEKVKINREIKKMINNSKFRLDI